MKSKFYLFLILLFPLIGNLYAQQTDFYRFDSPINSFVRIDPDCGTWGPVQFPIDVTGLPILNGALQLDRIELGINNFTAGFDLEIVLFAPNGNSYILADTDALGSWPGLPILQQTIYVFDCPGLYLDHNNTPIPISGGSTSLINGYDMPNLLDPNGTWSIEICNSGDQVFDITAVSVSFKSIEPYGIPNGTTNAPDCNSLGSADFFISQGGCDPLREFFYGFDGGSLTYGSYDPTVDLFISVSSQFTPGNHSFYVYPAIDPSTPDLSIERKYDFTVGVDNPAGAFFDVVCPADQNILPNTLHNLVPPTLDDNCMVSSQITKFTIEYPDGTTTDIDPYDPLQTYQLDPSSQSGTYRVTWFGSAEGFDGLIYSGGCTQLLTTDPNVITTFSSPICSSTPQDVTFCATVNNSQFFPVTVSGQPAALSPDYGLRGVWLDLNITDFSTQLPYVDIVDPTGFRHRLFNPFSFPQFNGATQNFRVFMTACNSAGIARAVDDVPFVDGGDYRPMSGALNVANQRGINPNGVWQLQTCAGTTSWSINCFELDFGPMCDILTNYSFGEEDCQTYVQVVGADISNIFCDDMNEDGLPDYYISIDGGNAVTWDQTDHLKTFVTPGAHVLEFGELQYDESGNAIFACRQFFNINAPTPTADTQDPTFSNCPSDFNVILNGNGEATFDITEPDFSDNCQISTERLLVTYLDGATAINGSTGLDLNFIQSGTTTTWDVKGEGKVEFMFEVTDASNNTGTCLVTVTASNTDPCNNDTEAPMLMNCPADATYVSMNNMVTFSVTHPTFSDNCGIQSAIYVINWLGGTSDDMGVNTPITIDFITFPGATNSGTVLGTGSVRLDYEVTDFAGNTATCSVTFTITDGNDPCNNDTQDPVFTDCPSDQTIVLDGSGVGTFNLTDPDFSDNCMITTESLVITYGGGATNSSGMTVETYSDIIPGANYNYGVIGTGTITFDYIVTDQAGNTGQCIAVVTAKDPTGPCNNDVTDPTLTNCQQNSNIMLDNNDMAMIDIIAPNASDNCGIQTRSVQVTYSGGATDEFGNTTRSFVNFSNGASRKFTIIGAGTLSAEFTVADPFGNTATCSTIITTIFSGSDVIFNPAGDCIVPGGRLSIPVRVTNFTDIGAFSFDLSVPAGSGLSFVGLENENLPNVSFNVLGNGDLRVAWDEPGGNDLTLANNTRIFNVVIQADASFNTPTMITGKDVVILQQGIPVMGRVDIANICVGSGVTPKGKIYSPLNKPHAGVEVSLLSGSNTAGIVNTDAQGNYGFATTNNTFRITPFKNDEVRKGVTISDVARIRRHFLQKLTLDTDYKIVAADVNKDGKINVIDVAFTNRVFLRKLDAFPGNTAWRFVPVAADISKNPLNVNIPNKIDLNQSGLDFDNLDFYSIKTGDVDHSSLVRGSNGGVNRIDVTVTVPDTILSPAEMVEIPVYLSGTDKVSAMSLTMSYDSDVLELVSISSPNLPSFGAGSYNDIDGEVLIGWDHPQGDDVDAEGTLMIMTFMSKVEEGSSDITLSDPSFFDINLDEIGVNATSGSVTFMTSSVFDINENVSINAYPNPFNERLNMEFDLDRPQPVTITLRDVTGKVIRSINIEKAAINEKIVIDNIQHQGVIMIEVNGQNFTETLKVMKL